MKQFSVALSGLTLTGSSATFGLGGAILNLENLSLTNCTLVDNSAAEVGGILNAAGSMMLLNTIVADSTSGGDVFNEDTLEGSNNLIE